MDVTQMPAEVLEAFATGKELTDEQAATADAAIRQACENVRNQRPMEPSNWQPARTNDMREHPPVGHTLFARVRDLKYPSRCCDCGARIVRGVEIEKKRKKFACALCAHERDTRGAA